MTYQLQYEESIAVKSAEAIRRFRDGEKPSYSTGICESITAGYGRLDQYGYWEFPLPVNQETLEIEL